MSMRLTQFGQMIAIVALSASLARAEGNQPSQDTLSAMGLGGLAVMSDDEAMSIRGMGFKGGNRSSVSVFGNSFATIDTPIGGAHSENGYTAEGKHFAKGSNKSFAGAAVNITLPGGKGGKPGYGKGGKHGGKMGGGKPGGRSISASLKFFAGGHSSAKAW